jgi:4'-phosphopantetheinyl transferase EntD
VLERILSPPVVIRVAGADHDPIPWAEEAGLIERAVEKRRREFLAGRDCARAALAGLGLPPRPIPRGPQGEPLWPTGVVGSITHCAGYVACALAHAADLRSLGIDAEPDLPLPDGVLAEIALPEERALLADLALRAPGLHWDRLLFCVKEAIYKACFPLYKACFPLTERRLGFEDAVVTIDPATESFTARLLVPGPLVEGQELRRLEGRLLAADGLLFAAVALPAC